MLQDTLWLYIFFRKVNRGHNLTILNSEMSHDSVHDPWQLFCFSLRIKKCPFHLISSHTDLISTHLIGCSSHLISCSSHTHLIIPHLTSSHLTLISSHLNSTHLMPISSHTHLICSDPSYLISCSSHAQTCIIAHLISYPSHAHLIQGTGVVKITSIRRW